MCSLVLKTSPQCGFFPVYRQKKLPISPKNLTKEHYFIETGVCEHREEDYVVILVSLQTHSPVDFTTPSAAVPAAVDQKCTNPQKITVTQFERMSLIEDCLKGRHTGFTCIS